MKTTSADVIERRHNRVAIGKAEIPPVAAGDAAEGFWYAVKRRLLGPPLINEQLTEERLSKTLGLGVLSCDGISSANYGSELILHELLPFFGLTAFTLLLPLTGVILFGVAIVVLSYREVVSVYTRAGGSYVVARENFGPRVAQVAAVALMIDYVVTVAVQTAAGSQAILSTFPALARPLGGKTTLLLIAATATLIMCYVNLLGVRENGKTFALPTYLFSGSVGLMILVGLAREAFGGGLPRATWGPGIVTPQHHPNGLLTFAAILILARAFANGGSSLTGIEAVSNAVSALRPPEGRNARHLLVTQGSIVGFLIAGISWLAHVTHAIPYIDGFPTVVSQEAKLVFGHTLGGNILFYLVQAGAITILFTGGNTSFSGFPFLTSFVAEDSFLPRWLSKRGHRLVFSNGIIVLTVLALALLLVVGANTNNLVPFYAIGVFTGFSMAGFGMARYHTRTKEPAWRRRRVINFVAGVYTALVVVIFAIVKFTEGAWLVVVVFPIGVFAFIRLNREYRMESQVLERIGSRPKPPEPPTYARRTVFVFVDSFDLAAVAALRYARSLRPTSLRAVHFVIDAAEAEALRQDWVRANTGIALDFIDAADRRLGRAAAELVAAEAGLPGVGVTVILPRRSYSPLLGRLLHDRTADKIAAVVSQIPHAAATIVPFDVRSRLQAVHDGHAEDAGHPARPERAQPASAITGKHPGGDDAGGDGAPPGRTVTDAAASRAPDGGRHDRPVPPPGIQPIGSLTGPGRAMVEGRVYAVEIRPVEQNTVLAAEIADSTGHLTALFYGRSHITGLDCGARVRFRGQVGMRDGGPVMINPAYELVAPGTPGPSPAAGPAGEGAAPPGSPPRRGGGPRRRKGQ
jgi:amino acid transporter